MLPKNIELDLLEKRTILAIRNKEELEAALQAECRIVFVLFGNIASIKTIVAKLKQQRKIVFVHEGLIEGLSSASPYSMYYLHNHVKADGIITTRLANAKKARELGLYVVYRFFILDSLALENMAANLKYLPADMIEVLPGLIPKVISRLTEQTNIPIVAGGLIETEAECRVAWAAGAIAVSTSCCGLWTK